MRKILLNLFFFLCGFKVKKLMGTEKGTILIQIDGLSFTALQIGIKKGYCPTLKNINMQESNLKSYYCGLPAATTSTEALLFYGSNFNIPGFTWFDRELMQFVRGNRSKELSEFEDSYVTHRKLLSEGSAIMSVFTGGATELSVSGRNLTLSRSYYFFIQTAHYFLVALLYPVQLIRTLYLTAKTLLFYNKSKYHTAKETFSKIALGQFSCYLAEVEIMRNTKNIFVDFLLYDEFAHEYGPTHTTTLSTLRLIDRYVKRIIQTTKNVDRKYEVIIFSDHGQTESIPFDLNKMKSIESITQSLEDKKYHVTKTYGGFIPDKKKGELYVVPAGSTLQLYFSDYLDKGVYEAEINTLFPQFITRLLAHEEFGWLLVKCGTDTARLYGKKGSLLFKSDHSFEITGVPFPQLNPEETKNTIKSFSTYFSFPNNGDIVLFGNVGGNKKVISFENHKGTHGGFYGPMIRPFIMMKDNTADLNSMESLFDAIAKRMR